MFPFAAWALIRAAQRPSFLRIILAAIFIALIMLSHTAASLLFLGPLLVFGGSAAVRPGFNWQSAWPQLRGVLLAFLLGLGLSAFSWLPALAEVQYTRYETEAGKVDYRENFADILRWPDTTIAEAHNPALPKSAGFAQIGLGLVGAGLALFSLGAGQKKGADFSVAEWLTTAAGLLGLATLFLAHSWSGPIWELIAPLRGLQFPWRLLDIPLFFLALAAGRILLPSLSRWRAAAALFGLLLACANMIPYLYPPRINLPAQPTLADATAAQQQFGIFGLTAWGEYSNPDIQTWPTEPPFPGADEFIPLNEKVMDAPDGLTAVSGDPWEAAWQTNLSEPATLTFNVHDFAGWKARLDDEVLPVQVDDNGRIQLPIPAGEHTLELAFRRTPIRWLADAITVLSLVLAGIGFILSRRSVNGRSPSPAHHPDSPTWLVTSFIALLVGLLFLKAAWLDRADNPLVVHLVEGQVSNLDRPETGSFEGKIQLIGSRLEATDQLVLLWQAQQGNLPAYQITLTLLDTQGTPIKTVRSGTPGYTVTTNWEAGQLIRDEYTLPINLLKGPVGYEVLLSIVETETGRSLSLENAPEQTAVNLGRLKKEPPETAVVETMGTQFGNGIRLRHVEFPEQISANEPLQLTFYWESIAPVTEDYTVFVHLLSADDSLAAGQDAQPVAGLYPTSFWEPGEIVVDGRQWQPDLPPGTYRLQVGLYLLATGERLSLSGPHSELSDRIILGEIEVRP